MNYTWVKFQHCAWHQVFNKCFKWWWWPGKFKLEGKGIFLWTSRPKRGISIFQNSKLCIITQICWKMCHIWKKNTSSWNTEEAAVVYIYIYIYRERERERENCKLSWDKEVDFTMLGVREDKVWLFFFSCAKLIAKSFDIWWETSLLDPPKENKLHQTI